MSEKVKGGICNDRITGKYQKARGGGRNLKKFLAMFLTVCVCMTTFQLNAFAESTPEGKNDVTPATALEFSYAFMKWNRAEREI